MVWTLTDPVTAGRNTDAIVALIENGADMDIIHGQQLIGCLGDNNGNIAVILGTAGMNRNSKTRNGFLHFRNDLGPEDNRGVIFFKKLGYGMRIGTIAPQIGRGLKGPFTGLDSKVLGVNNDPSIKDGGLQRADFHAFLEILQDFRNHFTCRGGGRLHVLQHHFLNDIFSPAMVIDDHAPPDGSKEFWCRREHGR